MLLYRILTVLVIAPLFFWVNLYASDAWFNLFWLTLVALAAREWGGLLRWPPRRQWKYALINAGIAALGLLLLEYGLGGVAKSRLLFYILAAAALLWLFAVPYALYRYGRDQRLNLPDSLLAVAGSIMLLAFVWATVAIQRERSARSLYHRLVQRHRRLFRRSPLWQTQTGGKNQPEKNRGRLPWRLPGGNAGSGGTVILRQTAAQPLRLPAADRCGGHLRRHRRPLGKRAQAPRRYQGQQQHPARSRWHP